MGPGNGPCPLPAFTLALMEKAGTEPSLPPSTWGRETSAAIPGEVVAGEETPRKAGEMCWAVHPAGLEAKPLPGLTRPCPRGGLGGREGPPSSL